MPKRLTISLLGFFAGVAGNLVAGWLQQGKWLILLTPDRIAGTLIGVALILFITALLESEHALSWNWRWHRFWYFLELLKNPDLYLLKTNFARLAFTKGRQKLSNVEVIANGKRQDMVNVLREQVTGRDKSVCRSLVLGEPGSGKTTGLERLTFDLTRKGAWRLGFGWPMPILVRLVNFQQGKLLDYVADAMRHGTKKGSSKVLSKGLEKLIERGRVTLLFDGLDEALAGRREIVLAELASLLESKAYEKVNVVITSRTRQDPGSRLKRLQVFEIQDLDDKAVEIFIRAYKPLGHNGEEINEQLQRQGLLEAGGLGRNPFWLRHIVETGAFAGNKAEILDKAMDTLLFREWDEKPEAERAWQRVLPREEQLQETKHALAWLGYRMSVKDQLALKQELAEAELAEWLKKRKRIGIERLRPQDILGLGQDAQILDYQPGRIRFRHRLLQEFMTAAWWLRAERGLSTKELERCVQNTEWWETLFLLGGLLDVNGKMEVYNELVQNLLGDGTDDQRILATIGLLRSVNSPPEELSRTAIQAFAASVGEHLTSTQLSAVQELDRILGDEAAEIFGVLFRDSDRQIRKKGALPLLNLKGKRKSEIIFAALQDNDKYNETMEILVAFGPLAVESLIPALSNPDDHLRKRAADVLARIGAPAVAALITIFRQSDEDIRTLVEDTLVKIGTPIIAPLKACMRECEVYLRMRTIEILKQINDPAAIELIIYVLDDYSIDVRCRAASALGDIGDPRAVKPLIDAMHDPSTWVRRYAASALGKISDPSALPELDWAARRRSHRDGVETMWVDSVAEAAWKAAEKIRERIKNED